MGKLSTAMPFIVAAIIMTIFTIAIVAQQKKYDRQEDEKPVLFMQYKDSTFNCYSNEEGGLTCHENQ